MDAAAWYPAADARGCWLFFTACAPADRAGERRELLIARLRALAKTKAAGLWPGELPLELQGCARDVLWEAVSGCAADEGAGFAEVAVKLLRAEEEAAAHGVQGRAARRGEYATVVRYLEECSVRSCGGATVSPPLPALPELLPKLVAASPAGSPLRALPDSIASALVDDPAAVRPTLIAALRSLLDLGEQDTLSMVTDTLVHAGDDTVAVFVDTTGSGKPAAAAGKKRKRANGA